MNYFITKSSLTYIPFSTFSEFLRENVFHDKYAQKVTIDKDEPLWRSTYKILLAYSDAYSWCFSRIGISNKEDGLTSFRKVEEDVPFMRKITQKDTQYSLSL